MSDKENVATAASTSRFGFKGGGKPAPKPEACRQGQGRGWRPCGRAAAGCGGRVGPVQPAPDRDRRDAGQLGAVEPDRQRQVQGQGVGHEGQVREPRFPRRARGPSAPGRSDALRRGRAGRRRTRTSSRCSRSCSTRCVSRCAPAPRAASAQQQQQQQQKQLLLATGACPDPVRVRNSAPTSTRRRSRCRRTWTRA